MTKPSHDFERGFYCAVAALLREGAEQQARSIFPQGGNPMHADACDIEVFQQHGFLPAITRRGKGVRD